MGLICISRGSYSRGIELAQALAAKLGCACIGRDELVEIATQAGIAVGKLEMAIVKRRQFDEALILEKEHYQALVTKELCERALSGRLVYHGRAGAMLLSGVSHILRLRVVEDLESRLTRAGAKLGLSRDKALRYIEELEDDLHRWVRSFYNIDWSGYSNFDLVVNLESMSIDSVATALCPYAQLATFQETPAVRVAMENLLLGAKARIALARDRATYRCSFKVTALGDEVSVAYQPRDATVAEHIPRVVGEVEGVARVRSTMASTNILWLEEEFSTAGPKFDNVLHLAERWSAGVELLRLIPVEGEEAQGRADAVVRPLVGDPGTPPAERAQVGGIEDDTAGAGEELQGGGLQQVWSELARLGLAGAAREIQARPRELSQALDRSTPYSLVVVGGVFRSKGSAAQVRLKRELGSQITDALRVPVVDAADLGEHFMRRTREIVHAAIFLVILLCIFVAVFSNQSAALNLLVPETLLHKVLAAAFLMVFIPLVAFLYGNITRTLLRLLQIE